MARIAGTNIPREKRVEISLTYVYGIGKTLSNRILKEAGVSPDKRVHELTDDEVNSLRTIIEKQHLVEGDLRREVSFNIKRLQEIGSYRGTRHTKGLPSRGQRTKTNSRTRRGNKRAINASSGKKPAQQKT